MAKKGEYDTEGSQVITDLSTNRACGCLTSQIGRDMVFSAKYGRTRCCVVFFSLPNRVSKPFHELPGYGTLCMVYHKSDFRTKGQVTYAIKDTVSVLYWYWKLSGLNSGTILRKNLRIFFLSFLINFGLLGNFGQKRGVRHRGFPSHH